MSETETSNERTILDYLNEDCWRAVLCYVPVRDIVQSERVSRRWQRAILAYLQGIRFSFPSAEESDPQTSSKAATFTLPKSRYESFERWTSKLGSSVVATYCTNKRRLKCLIENCPNLEALTFINFKNSKSNKKQLSHNFSEHFKSLKRLCFDNCRISDQSISPYIADRALEELVFYHCDELTAQCLDSANLTYLKSLTFNTCLYLDTSHFISSANRLGELRKLELIEIPEEIINEIQKLLDKMPKLEWLEIYCHGGKTYPCYLREYEPLCRLSNLKHLSTDLRVTNSSVEAITRCCKELKTLELNDCECLNPDTLEAIGRNAGDRLTEVGLKFFCHLDNDDVVNFVRYCPELTLLAIGGTSCVTRDLPARVSAARHEVRPGHVLTLDLSDTKLGHPYYEEHYREEDMEGYEEGSEEDYEEDYEDLIVLM